MKLESQSCQGPGVQIIPKFYMLRPCHQCPGIRGGDTGRGWGRLACDGRALINQISALIKKVRERCPALSTARSMDRVVNPQQKQSARALFCF